mmetsp:Transcript_6430/g.19470  ORF Transcript_6430/g.19470 Transcript_6430/m.19470 type:complete len:266 (+) Transcript_6430:62-859(+)|eukprot:CAMPEP_0198733620 /NCGR_PEP_ID=MMETSP1475-20131203/47023_1 /TAXON_ID= ORGANISM="Unidentified sp., Strain CCMP1999" /NCGR_SAMPLE_ID=MMETSP1475 /ASSEMBLY_ACC=CAM_ASM_001111 /LENGTH=265 /DNA_ID=CAMNT_0044496949 /DNA_START=24 /DNA_END=821 /DNA_ORIENTATION=-
MLLMDPSQSSSFISAEEQQKVEELRAVVEKKERLTEKNRTWLTDITYARFLRARNHNVNKAYKMLSNTIKWRKERCPEDVICTACRQNPRSHSLRAIGVDRIGRPVFYSCFHVDNRNADDNIAHLTHLLEHVFELECVTEQNYVWVMDFEGFCAADLHPGFAIQAMKMFQSHYPERMGKVLAYSAPKSFSKLYRILNPFIDANTKKKVAFIDHQMNPKEFQELFDEPLSMRLQQEIKYARETPSREFWRENPVPPMVNMNIHVTA